ncbi:unnamed protein product [Adineta steineri]|uniref:Dol-P-Glc:Glc(2)Man(9)GlcNAc(2)-PP-Dol alpha-1,2-glucosyltransferase n=1 Tax=Adineta steineri TaxID=433720 RepID=A0A818IJY4_9BILA|nr:unnamed protein product [Adineta steineri]CAF3525704.1 unnamed protein product [Adineta steineri]
MAHLMIVNLILYTLFAVITLYLFAYVHQQVQEPYMDEYFHFHQAANYCSGNYRHWDPSITTPPGLYLITHSIEMILNNIQLLNKTFGPCSLGLARFTNVIFMLALPFVFIKYLKKMKKEDEKTSTLSALCISCHPLIYFFTFLYYTDVGSLFFAMISLTTYVYHYHLWSAMFSLIALTFRQTNIIIVAYEIGLTIIEEFRLKSKQSHILHVYTSRSSDTIDLKEYLTVLWKYGRIEIKFILKIFQTILWKCRYNICVIIFFIICFIKNNYSITLGHQEHHQMVLHLAQMHYYAIYTAFFVCAHLLTSTNFLRLYRFLRTHPIIFLILLLLINLSIKYYTYEHLFLISDNRHYTFYIWSRLFKRYSQFRYLISPIYGICIILLYFQIYDRSLLNILLLLICIILLTIFQKLLEFRYFILPFILLRLSINDKKTSKLILELIQAIIINGITLYIFCHRTFSWPTHPNILQRFMY